MDHVRSTDARLALAVKAGALGIWELNIETGDVFWSPEVFEMFGVAPPPPRLRIDDVLQVIHPDDRARIRALVEAAIDAQSEYKTEYRVVRPDGTVRWMASRGTVETDDAGRPVFVVGMVQDITERVATLAALEDNRERLQAALDASKTGTWRWDIRANTLSWDSNLKRLFGLAPEHGVPTLDDFLALIHPDDRQTVADACSRSIEDGSESNLEYRVEWPDGSLHWIDDRGRTVLDASGRPLYMTGACVDITERKHVEQALRDAETRKDEFLAMLAHELRNPLAPIRTAVAILRHVESANETSGEALAIMERQIRHLVRLVDDLLDVSRITRGKIELRKERCSLSHIVQQSVDDYRQIFRDRGIAVTVSLPPDDLCVDGDPTRIAQIVSNVLHNSSKFTPKGGSVTVRLARDPQTRSVVVTIQDTGTGIDKELLGRLFDPFAQGRRDDTTQTGLGLGLAVVRGLTELHGGWVTAASDGPGKGSTFEVHFPPAAGTARPAVRPAAPRAARALRILVVDDNVDAADSLSMILELLGHQTKTVYLGQDAIGAAEIWKPDVLICDIGLPGGMDGYDVARQFRANPSLRDVHLIALTGWGQAEDRRKALDAGFDLHLTKPVSPDHLESVLASISR
jgi:two-component system CheB/CheR fusion protein